MEILIIQKSHNSGESVAIMIKPLGVIDMLALILAVAHEAVHGPSLSNCTCRSHLSEALYLKASSKLGGYYNTSEVFLDVRV